MSRIIHWLRKFRRENRSPLRDCEMSENKPVKQEARDLGKEDTTEKELDDLIRGTAAIRVGDRISESSPRAAIPPEKLW